MRIMPVDILLPVIVGPATGRGSAGDDPSGGAWRPGDEDDQPLAIPHAWECEPRRPACRPRWEPGRDRRDAGRPRHAPAAPRIMREVSVEVAPDLGHVRINFNYGNVITTTAAYGEKPRRQQYCEGPHEARYRRLLEMSTAVIDYQFQPLVIRWIDAASRPRAMFPDVGIELESGAVVFGEIKATSAYLYDPATRAGIDAGDGVLRPLGAGLVGMAGTPLAKRPFARTVKAAYDDRRHPLSDGAVIRAQSVIAEEGGAAPLYRVLPALANHPATAMAMLHAAMLRRLLTYDISRPPTASTPIVVPAPQERRTLRDLLSRLAQERAA